MSVHKITIRHGYDLYIHEAQINGIDGSYRIQYKGYDIVWNRTLISFVVKNAPYDKNLYDSLVVELLPHVQEEEKTELRKRRNENLLMGKTAFERAMERA